MEHSYKIQSKDVLQTHKLYSKQKKSQTVITRTIESLEFKIINTEHVSPILMLWGNYLHYTQF